MLRSRILATTTSTAHSIEADRTSSSPRDAARWPTPPVTATSPTTRRTMAATFHQVTPFTQERHGQDGHPDDQRVAPEGGRGGRGVGQPVEEQDESDTPAHDTHVGQADPPQRSPLLPAAPRPRPGGVLPDRGEPGRSRARPPVPCPPRNQGAPGEDQGGHEVLGRGVHRGRSHRVDAVAVHEDGQPADESGHPGHEHTGEPGPTGSSARTGRQTPRPRVRASSRAHDSTASACPSSAATASASSASTRSMA